MIKKPEPSAEATYHPTAVAVTLTELIREHLKHCLRTIRGVDCPDLLHIVDEWAQKIAKDEPEVAALKAELAAALKERDGFRDAMRVFASDSDKLEAKLAEVYDVLNTIAEWKLPETGIFRCSSDKIHTPPCDGGCGQYSFSFEYGSAGEKEYFRTIARKILNK